MVNRRKTAVVVLSGVAGVALVGGSLTLATTASADTHRHRSHGHRHGARPPMKPPVRPSLTPTAGPAPTLSATPTATPTRPPTPGPTSIPTPGPTATPTSGPGCSTFAGDPATVARPGVGQVTVTVKVCDGKLNLVTSTQSQSNWDDNEPALPAMDKLSLSYALTDINMVNYSGATLTSTAYRTSLASALDKAGL